MDAAVALPRPAVAADAAAPGRRLAWLGLLALWAVPAAVALGQIVIEQTLAGEAVAWRAALWTTLPNWVLWALLTPPVAMLAARFAPGRAPRWQIAGALLAGGALALGAHAVGNVAAFHLADLPAAWTLDTVATHFSLRAHVNALAFGLVVAATWTWRARERQRERERREAQLQTALARAELQALRMQVRPHFLFNALHAVGATVRRGEGDRAVTMLSRLGELLRLSLESDGAETVPLRRELDVVERYLELEGVRFADRLSVEIDAPPEVRRALVPAWALQPLVENAIKHGVAPQPGPAHVRVAAARDGDRLRITVADSGPGPGASASTAPSTGLGLRATRERLRAHYGDAAALRLGAAAGGGTVATVELPFETA